MKYAAYSKMARTYSPVRLIPLDRYCQSRGVDYFVSTNRPTLVEFDPQATHLFINYPEKSVTVPASETDEVEHILSLIAYVGQRYDAIETISYLHRKLNAQQIKPEVAVEVDIG
jgi:hypothetical protein